MSAYSNIVLFVYLYAYCVFLCGAQLDYKLPGAETMFPLFIAEYFASNTGS